ncbi:hypothetical protein J3R82DRAFT_9559 [Butyriboletus roseoflavus]|nr:hypothetical protein J3R82DRAFT_9559 [Butyriboletus roseoflavus]
MWLNSLASSAKTVQTSKSLIIKQGSAHIFHQVLFRRNGLGWHRFWMKHLAGTYLDEHVMGGYKYLMDNYHTGDKICLLGFSRGAYTARALAGMLHKVGLLPRDNLQQVNFAYKAFKRTDKLGVKLAAGFKRTFSRDVKVEFVGVWDTVQSTGILVSRMLPFTESNNVIKVFRHALSLDEHRARFRPNLYHWPPQDNEPDQVAELKDAATRKAHAVKSTFKRFFKGKDPRAQLNQAAGFKPLADGAQRNGDGNDVASDTTEPKAKFAADELSPGTDVLEVWFSGCHSDIGGGNVQDDVKVSLAQIALHWMVEQVIQSQCGILFDNDELARIGFTAPPPQPSLSCGQVLPDSNMNDRALVASEIETTRDATDISACIVQELPNEPKQPTPSPETYPEHSDAIAPLYDELKITKLWWLLEIMPSCNALQDANGVWHNKWR